MIMINAKAQPLQDRWKKCGENNLEIYKDKLTACVQKVKRNIDIIGEASPGECIIDGQYKLIENVTIQDTPLTENNIGVT